MDKYTKPPKPPRRRPPPRNPDDNPGGRGRPPMFNPDRAERILVDVLMLVPPLVAAKANGIGRTAFQRWLRLGRLYPDGNYGAFRTLYFEARGLAQSVAHKAVYVAALKDGRLMLELLARLFPNQYAQLRIKDAEKDRRLAAVEERIATERRERERAAAAENPV